MAGSSICALALIRDGGVLAPLSDQTKHHNKQLLRMHQLSSNASLLTSQPKNNTQKLKPGEREKEREAQDDPEQEPDESEDEKRCPCDSLIITNRRLLAAGTRSLEPKHVQDAVSCGLQWIGGISATLCHQTDDETQDETQRLPEPTAPGPAAGLYTSTGMRG